MIGVGAYLRARPASPYKGLAPFEDSELDALLFFGREQETEIVTANLVAARLTVLYGPSGVGKSSLLCAAVARELRSLPERPVVVVFDGWSDSPAEALSAAVAEEAGIERSATLLETVERALAARTELYLALDQFDEYFLYHGRGRPSEAFAEDFPELANGGELRIHIVVGIREDALAQLDFFKSRIPTLFGNYLRLDHLDREKARSALVGPLRRWEQLGGEPVTIEPELVEAVLDEVTAGRVALGGGGRGTTGNGTAPRIETPYLQLVMQRLWDEDPTALRLETLERLGGAARIVGDHLDDALGVLSESQKASAALMFDHLVTPSGTKIAHGVGDLSEFAHAPPAEVSPILRVLAEQRILRPVADGGDDGYEIYHDVLAAAVLDWRRRFDARKELELARAESERRRRQALRIAALSLAALLIVVAVAIFALTQRQDARTQARSARARALAATALTQLPIDPERALVLARDAGRLTDSRQVEDVLRQALIASRVRAIADLHHPVSTVTFGNRLRSAVAVTDTGRVATIDATTGQVVRSFDTGAQHVALDPQARYALAYGPRNARWHRVADGASRSVLAGPRITDVVYSPDGDELVTLHKDRRLRLWQPGAATPTRTILLPGVPVSAAVSRNGALVAAAVGGKETLVFDGETGRLVRRLPQPSVVTGLEFGPSAKLLAVVGADNVVRVFHPRRGSAISAYEGHLGPIVDTEFSPHASKLATASTDGTARVWKVGSRGGLLLLLSGHHNKVTSVSFSRNASFLITGSTDRTARVWSATGGDSLALLAGHRDSVTSARFSRDDRLVVTGSKDGTVRFWDPRVQPLLVPIQRFRRPVPAARYLGDRIVVAPPGALDVAVSADGTAWATVRGRTVVVHRGSSTRRFSVPQAAGGIALSPDGETVAVMFRRGIARLYSADGRPVRTLHGGRGALLRTDFSPDGRLLAAGSTDKTAKLWDVRSGRLLREFKHHTDDVMSARFSRDGLLLVTASRDHDAIIWDVRSGHLLNVLRVHFGNVSDAAFSPSGRWVVTAGPGKAGLFDASTGVLEFLLQGHERPGLTSASFSPDGRRILTSGWDGTVRSWKCEICGRVPSLEPLADRRLARTHRRLTKEERAVYVP